MHNLSKLNGFPNVWKVRREGKGTRSMEYRVDVFSDNKTEKTYFNNLIDAVLFGQEQLAKVSEYGVFLLKENAIGKYDVTCAIK